MKLTILYSFLIYSKFASGQISIENITGGSFLSKEQDRIAIISKNPLVLMGETSNMDNYYLENGQQINNLFYFKMKTDGEYAKDPYSFKIVFFKNDSILMVPSSNNARQIFGLRNEIRFYKQKYFTDSTISFEKLFYYSGQSSNHFSDGISLIIDSSRNVLLKLSAYDNRLSGNYKGHLTDEGYNLLIRFLKEDNLKTLFWPKSKYYGQDPKKLILYFNHQKKELNSIGDSPYVTMNLLMLLEGIKNYANLEKVAGDLELNQNN